MSDLIELPAKIYLQPGMGEEGSATWREDQIEDDDIVYIRADVVDLLRAELANQDEISRDYHGEVIKLQNMVEIERGERVKLRAELEAAKAANRWIPVGERLPELSRKVCEDFYKSDLVLFIDDTGHYHTGMYTTLGWFSETDDYSVVVTHWKPLLEPSQDTPK
jgi:hypothetical protein